MVNVNVQAKSNISEMKVWGYTAKMLYGNINNWVLSVLETNPGIIDQIAEGPYANYIKRIINDKDSYLGETRQRIAIEKFHGFGGKRSLMITTFKENTSKPVEYDISKQKSTLKEFGKFEGVTFYADTTSFGSEGAVVGIGFTDGDKKWFLKENDEVILMTCEGGKKETVRAVSSREDIEDRGRILIPADFKGFVYIPVSEKEMGLQKPEKFLFALEETEATKNKSAYFSDFSVVSDVFGEKPEKKNIFSLYDFALGETNNEGGWEMVVWFNEYSGKLLTGIALQYMSAPSKKLKEMGDKITEGLSSVQYEDGYLGIYPKETRLGRNQNWDIWGHYHQIYGLLSWYRITGNTKALSVAVRAAECIYNEFYGVGRSMDEFGENQHVNFATTHAFAELYKETKNSKYLDAVMLNVEKQWPNSGNWLNNALEGKEFYQGSLKRWEALHPIFTLGTLYEITGEEKYYRAFEQIRNSIVKTDRHISGAFSTYEAAQGTTYTEGPIETCCSVAWQAFSSKYLEFSKKSQVADEIELTYFNVIFGSLLDGERLATYDTRTEGDKRIPARDNFYGAANFFFHSGATEFTCCQANIARGIGEISSWACTADDKNMYLNYYGRCSITTKTPGNGKIQLREYTNYPVKGRIRVRVESIDKPEKFGICFRIPVWAKKATVSLNGGEKKEVGTGKYCRISKQWHKGDNVEITLEMGFHFWVNEKDPSKAAIYYGPLLLAATGEEGKVLGEEQQFSAADLSKAKVSFSKDGRHWVECLIKTGEKEFKLVDFASSGKFDSYRSWLKVGGLPKAVSAEKCRKPIWCR